MTGNQAFVLAGQDTHWREHGDIELNQRIPCSQLEHLLVQSFREEEVTSLLPLPAKAEIAQLCQKRFHIQGTPALSSRRRLLPQTLVIGRDSYMTGCQCDCLDLR